MKTPLLYVTIPFALGIIAQRDLSLVIIVVILIFLILNWAHKFPVIIFMIFGFVMAMISEHHNKIPYGESVEIVGRIENTPTLSSNGRWQRSVCDVESFKDSSQVWKSVNQKVQLFVDTASKISLGNAIYFRSQQLKIDSVYGSYYLNKGITGTVFSRDFKILKTDTTLLERVDLFSAKLSAKIARINTSSQNIGLIQALTLGDKSGISREQRNENVRAGTAHILAVSGLHVGIIAMILAPLLGWIKLFRRGLIIYGLTTILLLWGYAAITGFSPPVLRAVIMFTIYQLGIIISRNSNNLNTLFAAGLVLLLYDPNFLFDIGFQLSFVAMFGIAIFYKPIYSIWRNRFWSLISISLAAQIAVIPLACYYFGNIPFFGIFTNLALWLVVPAIIILSFAYLASGIAIVGDWTAWVAGVYNDFVAWSSSQSWIAVENVDMPLWVNITIYALMIVCVKIWLLPKEVSPNL